MNLIPQILGLSLCLLLAGCGKSDLRDRLDYRGFNPSALKSEAAQKGLLSIEMGQVFSGGVPKDFVIDFLTEFAKGSEFKISGLSKSDLDGFRVFGTLPSSPNRDEEHRGYLSASFGLKFDPGMGSAQSTYLSKSIMVDNCFKCHAGVSAGIVSAGLFNSHLVEAVNFLAAEALVKKIKALTPAQKNDLGALNTLLVENFTQHYETFASGIMGQAQSRGEVFAPYSVWKGISRMVDPRNRGFDRYDARQASPYDSLIPKDFGPVDGNPWWTLKYKNLLYRYGDGSPYDADSFAVTQTHVSPFANSEHQGHVTVIQNVLAYARETSSPEYPGSLDPEKVVRGGSLFHGNSPLHSGKTLTCFECHGTYLKAPGAQEGSVGSYSVEYRDVEKPREVGTDPEYARILMGFKPLASRVSELGSRFGKEGKIRIGVPDRVAYMAPPLDGVWATAPYFHNGSVPSLEAVLDSSQRPKIWRKYWNDPFAYDFSRVGVRYDVLSEGEFRQIELEAKQSKHWATPAAVDYRSIYNTSHFGRSAEGHTYGDLMNPEERSAVIEFLKSLSGPNMISGDVQEHSGV